MSTFRNLWDKETKEMGVKAMNVRVIYENEYSGENDEYITTIADLVDSFNGEAVLLVGADFKN